MTIHRNRKGEAAVLLAACLIGGYVLVKHPVAIEGMGTTAVTGAASKRVGAFGAQRATCARDISLGSGWVLREGLDENGTIRSFDILKDGKQVHHEEGDQFESYTVMELGADKSLTCDMKGDGTQDLAVVKYTGGAHCCNVLEVFCLNGDSVHGIYSHDFADSDPSFARQKNGTCTLKITDVNFTYWEACYATSPQPEVILEWKNGDFRPAIELMKKPAPSETELEKTAFEVASKLEKVETNGQQNLKLSSDLWSPMLDLIYTGNAQHARRLLDLAWEQGIDGRLDDGSAVSRDVFWETLKEQCKRSPYYAAIAKMNGWS